MNKMTLKYYKITEIFYEIQKDEYDSTIGADYNEDLDKPLLTLVFNSMKKAIEHVKYTLLLRHEIHDIEDLSKGKDKEIIIFFGEDIKRKGVLCERAIRIEQNDNIGVSSTLLQLINGA